MACLWCVYTVWWWRSEEWPRRWCKSEPALCSRLESWPGGKSFKIRSRPKELGEILARAHLWFDRPGIFLFVSAKPWLLIGILSRDKGVMPTLRAQREAWFQIQYPNLKKNNQWIPVDSWILSVNYDCPEQPVRNSCPCTFSCFKQERSGLYKPHLNHPLRMHRGLLNQTLIHNSEFGF